MITVIQSRKKREESEILTSSLLSHTHELRPLVELSSLTAQAQVNAEHFAAHLSTRAGSYHPKEHLVALLSFLTQLSSPPFSFPSSFYSSSLASKLLTRELLPTLSQIPESLSPTLSQIPQSLFDSFSSLISFILTPRPSQSGHIQLSTTQRRTQKERSSLEDKMVSINK